MTDTPQSAPPAQGERCAVCGKPARLCVCAELKPVQTRLQILILQHPQEQDVDLGTARLITGQLPNARLKVGLSWPNLAKAVVHVEHQRVEHGKDRQQHSDRDQQHRSYLFHFQRKNPLYRL